MEDLRTWDVLQWTAGCEEGLTSGLRGLAQSLEGGVPAALGRPQAEDSMDEAATLERLLRRGHGAGATEFCEQYLAAHGPEGLLRLYGGVILPAIRRLEHAWQDDLIAFDELSMAFFQVHRLLVLLSVDRSSSARPQPGAGHVLVATAPGEGHVFGARVLSDMLRMAGHAVALRLETCPDTLLQHLERNPVRAVCLSVGHDQALDGLADLVAEMRVQAREASLKVLIGGPALTEPVAQYGFLGADLVALNAQAALHHLSLPTVDAGPAVRI